MNCVKGDLAYIVGLPEVIADANGRVVTCAAATTVCGEPGWVVERCFIVTPRRRITLPETGNTIEAGQPVSVEAIKDRYLRPIRDPGGLTDVRDVLVNPLTAEIARRTAQAQHSR